jgi:glycosyltransferase involved in cell wall biosynthesis
MDLSIIIPSFKRADLLEYGLKSLSQQKIVSQYEVIVLNDGVQDNTQQVCDSYKDKLNIRYVFTGQRNSPEPVWRIPGFAINIGARLARGRFMIIMCPEMYLLDDCVQVVIDNLKANPKSIVITEGKDDQDSVFLNNVRQKTNIEELNRIYQNTPDLNTEFPFFLGVLTEDFINIGGYDEDFIGNCWDDQDVIMRLKQNGASYLKLKYRIVHLYHSRLRYDTLKIREMWDYNKRIYDAKFGTIKRNEGREWGSLSNPVIEERSISELEKYFTNIYEKNIWNGKESKSGTGSDLAHTAIMRPQLISLINSLPIDSMLDLPCGDFNWMKEVIEHLHIKKYTGGDIIKPMLKENEIKYSGIPMVSAPKFMYLDAITDIPPKVDLIFCRDGLVHFSFNTITRILKNFINSGSTYLIMTTFTDTDRFYNDIRDGAWHPVNFNLPPFNFPKPYKLIVEGCVECDGIYADKSLGLWKLSDLVRYLEPTPGSEEREISIGDLEITRRSRILLVNKEAKVKVAHIHPWWDSAGVGIIHAKMMNEYTRVEVRHIVGGNTCLEYDTDLLLKADDTAIGKVLEESDILHFNTFWHDDPQLQYHFPWERYLKGKKLVFHMHGGSICFDYNKLEEIAKIATIFTCSPLLPKFMPFATWVPNILPIDESLCRPKDRESKKPIRFLFMVNHDHNKGRAEVEWLIQKLNEVYGYDIQFESWFHKYPYAEALVKRKEFDVIIDNITQGFIGMVGWEALSQAQVCIARLSPIVVENYTKLGNGEAPPIINVSGIDELAKTIIDLSNDENKVKEIQKQGRDWMEKYYNPKRLCQLWEKRYFKIMKNE